MLYTRKTFAVLCGFPACQSGNGGQVCVTLRNSYFAKNRKEDAKLRQVGFN